MARANDFMAHVLDLLSAWDGVTARRMFSGYGLFRKGRMFALVSADNLYLKTDERNRPEFSRAGMRPFTFRRARREVETSYWLAPPHLLDDGEELVRWAERAFAAALAHAAKTRSRTPRRGRTARKMTKI